MDRAKAISVAQATLTSLQGFGLVSPCLSRKNDTWTYKRYGWKVIMDPNGNVIQVIDEWPHD